MDPLVCSKQVRLDLQGSNILNPDKPKRISLTMANTLFGAMFGSRLVNWGLLIHKVVAKALPNIGKKSSFFSPFIFHLYQQYDLLLLDEEDELTIAANEVAYKLQPEAGETETSSDPIIPDAPPSTPGSPQPLPRPIFPPPPSYPPSPPPTHHPEAGPSGEATWRNVDPSAWDFLDNPFRRVQEGLEELQHQYTRLVHIARGANQALDNCGPGNIIREIAKRADRKELHQARKELDQVRNKNALLQAQVTTMSEELGQKSEELRRYPAEQSVAFNRIRELVGNPAEIVNKAHLYDRMMATKDSASARQTLPILVKYSRAMKDLLAEIQKVVPPGHTPRRVLYQGAPGSPTGTLYEVVGEVPLVQNPPTVAGPSLQEGGTRTSSSGRAPSETYVAGVRRKSTGSVRIGRDQSPMRRISNCSRTPDRARTPIRNPEPGASPSRGRGTPTRAPPTSPTDGLKTSPAPQPPSRAASSRDPRTTSSLGRQEQV